jgi:4-aminobutyrate aminotransferase-like enzyme
MPKTLPQEDPNPGRESRAVQQYLNHEVNGIINDARVLGNFAADQLAALQDFGGKFVANNVGARGASVFVEIAGGVKRIPAIAIGDRILVGEAGSGEEAAIERLLAAERANHEALALSRGRGFMLGIDQSDP